ncbi:E3 SUMO-protein ligase ZBED1-like [Cyprinus carpio]|uniref:E3 SUMO-protein ligase ZBED1-like n=1 Tax=Cyprinus carpio TaxID=7962 RepID=A0A9Q9Y481_CYPCA|nr:E3 SUMO-protein ligase ZBED1-like [Cyprinus carpio]
MASGGEARLQYEEAPASFKSVVWRHFGFAVEYNAEEEKTVNKKMTVCKHCFTRVAYSNGNTSNMTAHLRCHHPAITLSEGRISEQVIKSSKKQQSLAESFQHTYPTGSERHIKITKAVGVFIAKDLQPFSVIGDAGFCHFIKTLDPRYRLPSRTFFSTEIIPDLYEKTCNSIVYKLAEELIQVLTPLKTVTTLMSSETTPTISMILPLKEMILKSMSPGDQDSATVKEAKAAISNDLAKRYTDPNLHDYLQMATALDPRFKSLPYLDEDSCDKLYRNIIREILEHEHQGLVENPVPSTEEDNPSSPPPKKKTAMSEVFGELFKTEEQQGRPFPQIIEEEVTTYKLADSIHVDADPFIWWKTNECKFPHVAKAAQQHLCVPGTSVASERIVSTAGDIVSAKRSLLAAENVDRLIFLQNNLKIQE